ncbi:receptor-like protein kinase [Cajanus cajan]|uniref:receptor-like protein kinase n=1 Tax=Cajanus cajan TaxID=3821 RepID=UPI00098D7ABC|nr:receptor-like protein kinase [Cajanus cajan]
MMRLGLFMVFLSSLLYAINALNTEGVALLSLMRHWTFVPPSIDMSWNASDSTPCSWLGIHCDNNHNAVFLNLSGYSISGLLGPEIAHLSHLQTLDLSSNNLSGKIPPELGNCSLLQYVDLSYNNIAGEIPDSLRNLLNLVSFGFMYNMLTGQIPEFLFQLQHLEDLLLNQNHLSGPIPMNVGNGTKILSLYLDNNQLSGRIPPSIGNCSNLVQLYLEENQLHGVLPESLTNLKSVVKIGVQNNRLEGTIPLFGSARCKGLYYLDLSFNKFSGVIPSSLGNCSGLTEFYAPNNNLGGRIPSSLGQLSELSVLRLDTNHLSGQIPLELGNCRSLNVLGLNENELEGEIPSELGKLSKLQDLRLNNNHLRGGIPLSLWKISSLENVNVHYNNLSGELPLELTELKQLKNITLYNNQFTGVIPQNLGINTSLVLFDVSYNHFTGTIPPNLCFGQQLDRLLLVSNQFQGGIPIDIGKCTTLTRLRLDVNNLAGTLPDFESTSSLSYMNISENKISGPIPSSLGKFTNLTDVDLSNNKFSGHIPSELGSLVILQRLNLSHNKLEGPLPPELSNCHKMAVFDAGFNSLNGSLPSSLRNWTRLVTLNLRENRFTGGIPTFLSEFKYLSDLHLGGNNFGGQIPRTIGDFQNLFYGLNLSANELTGEIPPEIGKLKLLQSLDISLNNLTGKIDVLEDLSSLVALNISYNSFYGPLPDRLVNLLNSSPSSFLANPGLCVRCFPLYGLQCSKNNTLKPCDENNSTHPKGLSKVKVVMIALGSTLVVTFLLLGLVYVLHYKQDVKIFPKQNSSFLKKVMNVTENLNDRHIIGRGAHGVIYKVEFSSDEVFAIKKVPFADNKGQITSMSREIETAGKIKHRNLLTIKKFWLRKDCGLILYKYMENGSLHDVLHEKYPPPSLEWSVRYKIAIGIAHGLEYLHHDSDPFIVHRDIKPKNILLDSDMEPHIADFGIATLLDHSHTSLQSLCVPGTVGYIAPENAYSTVMSRKSDVYSYGVVLLELISRKMVLDDPSFMEETDLVGWVKSMWENTRSINGIVDSSLAEEFLASEVRKQVEQVLLVALRCIEKHPSERPTMREVVKDLIVGCKCSE